MAIPDRGIRRFAGESAGGDQHAFPDRTKQHHRRRHVLMVDLGAAGAGGARLDEMQIRQAKRVELFDRVGIERHRVRLAAAIGDAIRRQPHADTIRAPNLDDGVCHFHQEARAVRNRAAISIGAQVGVRLQELLDQIAIGTVNLDAVETGLERVLRGLPVGIDHAWNLGCFKCARRLVGHGLAVRRSRLQIGNRHCRRRNRQHAARLERGMRDAPDMPELQKNDSALGMNGVDHLAPACDLLLGVDAGHAGAAEACFHHRRGFGDQQPARRRALRVILGVQRPRRERGLRRPHPRQRRHRETVLELIGADLER